MKTNLAGRQAPLNPVHGERQKQMNFLSGIRLNGFPEQGSYLANLPVIRCLHGLGELHFLKPVTFLVEENGAGKSTLLEAIAVSCGFNTEGGSKDFSFSTKDSHSELYRYLTTIKRVYPKDGFFLRAESFYNTASYLDEVGMGNLRRYGGVSLHKRPHWESLMALATSRFWGNGLYILDEPEAALSPKRPMSLMVAIDELVKADSQLFMPKRYLLSPLAYFFGLCYSKC